MLRLILVGAGAAAVVWVERSMRTLVHTRTHGIVHLSMHVRVETGLAVAAPFVIVVLVLEAREQAKAKAAKKASAARQRPSYAFNQPGRRG